MPLTINSPRSAASRFPAADYFARARNLFQAALAGQDAMEDHFCIGGRNICLRVAGDSLARVVRPALAHLSGKPAQRADVTVGAADLAATKTTFEFPGGDFNESEPPGAMRRFDSPHHFILAQNETQSVSLLDTATGGAFYLARSAAGLPWMENTFPLRHLFARFFRQHGQQLIHAAAVGDEQGAVLMVGKGGSGKSTATLACATNGLFYLGDDYTLAGVDPEPRVWSLYGSAKVNADTLNWFPELKECLCHRGGTAEKSSLFLQGARQVRLADSRPIRAVLWPRITGHRETRLVPASPATLLLALAPSSILQTPGEGAAALQTLGRLVQTVPTFVLEAGNHPAGIASAIKKFLST